MCQEKRQNERVDSTLLIDAGVVYFEIVSKATNGAPLRLVHHEVGSQLGELVVVAQQVVAARNLHVLHRVLRGRAQVHRLRREKRSVYRRPTLLTWET